MRFRHVLCAVDFSKVSRGALRSAAALARASRGRLTVLFVDDPLLVAAAAAARDARASSATSSKALEQFIVEVLPRRTTRPARVRAVVAAGTPAEKILETASRDKADLIVIGTRGIGRAARLFLGTTAEAVLRRTRVPVLAVPGT